MGHFSDFLAIFQYNFGDSWDIHGMRPIILGFFSQQLPWKYCKIRTFHFRTSMIFQNFRIFFYRTYETGVVDIDITIACDISIWCVFFSTKTCKWWKPILGIIVYDPNSNRNAILNYPITPWLLCRDRPTAAHCACFSLLYVWWTIHLHLHHILHLYCTLLGHISCILPFVHNIFASERPQRNVVC